MTKIQTIFISIIIALTCISFHSSNNRQCKELSSEEVFKIQESKLFSRESATEYSSGTYKRPVIRVMYYEFCVDTSDFSLFFSGLVCRSYSGKRLNGAEIWYGSETPYKILLEERLLTVDLEGEFEVNLNLSREDCRNIYFTFEDYLPVQYKICELFNYATD